jgi:tRNA pseudouridine38-40 synthase
MNLKRLVFGVQYNGSPWHGWQTQPSGLTIQDALELALAKFAKCPISVVCAGRTDAGVHAIEQIVHFDTSLERSSHSWVSGVNAFLPPSIVVRWVKEVPFVNPDDLDNFHARFSAYSRTYNYLLYNNSIRSPIWSQRAGWVFKPLDLGLMIQAAMHLIGERDFTVFRAAACQAKSPIKHMYDIQIRQYGDLIVFSFRANAFLHHMVRNIVGALIVVGQRKKEPSWLFQLMESRDRSLSAPTFMPDGLYLARIDYDKKWNLPQDPISFFTDVSPFDEIQEFS